MRGPIGSYGCPMVFGPTAPAGAQGTDSLVLGFLEHEEVVTSYFSGRSHRWGVRLPIRHLSGRLGKQTAHKLTNARANEQISSDIKDYHCVK